MTEPAGPSGARYEIEFRRARQEGDSWRWQPLLSFDAEGDPCPVRFHCVETAHAYVARSGLRTTLRIVAVGDEGGREVVG